MIDPVLIDLFCGAGGAAKGYAEAGFRVIGVDINPQPNFPYEFHQADALEFDLSLADCLHASPPCQKFSTVTPNKDIHPDLVDPIRQRLMATGLPYVIENVPGAPLINPVRLCGSSFGLRVRRHRMFEANFCIDPLKCDHQWQIESPIFDVYEHGHWYKSGVAKVYGRGGGKANEHWNQAMGIDWMTPREIVESIPPVYTRYIGDFMMKSMHGYQG